MANLIKLSRSLTAGHVPASLSPGEIAINEADGLLFYRGSGGSVKSISLALVNVALAGTPTAWTPAPGDNSTKIATTEFVKSARDVAFTGAPTAPTQPAADSSIKIATTAFVKTAADVALAGAPTAQTPALTDASTKIATTAFARGLLKPPQGRLTLLSNVPVMTATVSNITIVYYTPYTGTWAPIYDGTKFVMTDLGGELSQVLTDATKSPASAVINSMYDMFLWDDAGTKRCTRGPAWTSDTARGTGAGTTEIESLNGIWVNKNAITNGPAARRGTYVGTFRTNSSGVSVSYTFGSAASGGGFAWFSIWNCYNRVKVMGKVLDTIAQWTYAVNAWAAMGGGWRVYWIDGLGEDAWLAQLFSLCGNSATGSAVVGIGYDNTANASGVWPYQSVVGWTSVRMAEAGANSFGYHYVAALQYSLGGSIVVYGNSTILTFQWRC